MKIKNVKCYLLGIAILTNSSFLLSCEAISDKFDRIRNRDFYNFLEDNGIVSISDLEDIPKNYYEAEVSEHIKISDDVIQISSHYEKLDRIDNVICQAKEFDYDYKVLKIENYNDEYKIVDKIIDDIDDRPSDYDYVYPDDYVISNGYRDVLIKYGKILRKE